MSTMSTARRMLRAVPYFLLALFCFVAIQPTYAGETPGVWDTQFTLSGVYNRSATAITFDAAGNVYFAVDNYSNADIVYKWDGTQLQALPPVPDFEGPYGETLDSTTVNSMAFDSSGNLYIAGYYEDDFYYDEWGFIHKWDGSSWTSLAPTLEYSSVGSVAVDSNDNVYIAGGFYEVDGVTGTQGLAMWDGTTWQTVGSFDGHPSYTGAMVIDDQDNLYIFAYDASYTNAYVYKWDDTMWTTVGGAFNSDVVAMVIDDSGDIYVTGYFSTIGGNPFSRWAVWDGTQWSALGLSSALGSNAEVLTLDSLGNLYAAGYGFDVNGTVYYVIRWDGSTWEGVSDIQDGLRAIAFDSADNLIVGGYFSSIGSVAAYGIAVWDGSAWGNLFSGNGVAGFVSVAITGPDGNLYVGGYSMQAAGNVPVRGVAMWDGTQWHALGGGLNDVRALAFDSQGNLYAGGYFTNENSDPNMDYIAMWDGTTWNALGVGLNGVVQSLAIGPNDEVYVGGHFYDVGGNFSADQLAQWDGTNWNLIGGTNGAVRDIAYDPVSNNLYILGDFSIVGQGVSSVAASNLARWDGTVWHAMPGVTPYFYGHISTDAAGNLYVNGNDGLIYRWNGTTWTALSDGWSRFEDMTVGDNGDLVFAGYFNDVTGAAGLQGLIRYDGTEWHSIGDRVNVYAVVPDGNFGYYVGAEFGPVLGGLGRFIGQAPVNVGPTAVDDTPTTNEDTAVTIDVLDNDSDPNNDPLSITTVSFPANGYTYTTFDNKIQYTPNENYNGEDSFTYTISDGALTATATVTVTISAINDRPDAVNDSVLVDADTAVTIDVLANDLDLENDPLTIDSVGAPSNGSASISSGQIIYTPTVGFSGTDSFTYVASDGGLAESATVTLLVGNADVWTQIGGDIGGEASGDFAGISVGISEDGQRVAVGAYNNDGANGADSGHVRVFDWNGSSWIQIGGDIDGTAAGDQSGITLSLSADGTRLAISSYSNGGVNNSRGQVRLFEWDGSSWTQMGASFDGTVDYELLGDSVSLSADGSILAIGTSGPWSANGTVRIYQWNGAAWIQLGSDLTGAAVGNYFGSAVSLTADGTRVAVGAERAGAGFSYAGEVSIYDWNGTAWVQVGSAIAGEAPSDGAGSSVAISADGNRVLVGAQANSGNGAWAGHIRIFEWSGTAWTQVGTDIDGEEAGDLFGYAPSISADGNRVAAGAPSNNGGGESAGHVRVFDWDGSAWKQVALDIDGQAGEFIGIGSALSADGSTLIAGAPGGSAFTGVARAYQMDGGNSAPVATDDVYSTVVDAVLVGNVITDDTGNGADSDPEGDSISVSNAGLLTTANGRVSLAATGDFFYQPDIGYTGIDTFTYSISDGELEDTATVTVTVTDVPPTEINVTLPSAGWNLFGYPLQEDQAVAAALTSIDGDYTIVWGYDAADATPWEAYSTSAPAWANDLQELKVGRGYWISMTQPATVTFSSGGGRSVPVDAPAHSGSLSHPPAAYFGTAPAADQVVEARVDGILCGQATSQTVDGVAVYVLHVASEEEVVGCGSAETTVSITVDGVAAATTVWNASNFNELNLSEATPTAVTLSQSDVSGSFALFVVIGLTVVLTLTMVVVVRPNRRLHFLAVSVALPAVFLVALPAMAFSPQQPHRIYGSFTVTDAAAGVANRTVVASADGVFIADYAVTTDGTNPTNFVFDIPADDPETAQIEGATNGQTISFSSDGIDIATTFPFVSGDFDPVDLTANLAATVGVDENGDVTIDLSNGAGGGSGITAVYSPTLMAMILSNPGGTLTAGSGATQLGPGTIAIPVANIAGGIDIAAGDENDLITIDLSEGSPFPPGTVVNIDGAGGDNQVEFVGVGAGNDPSHSPTDPTSGSFQVGGVTYNYSNMEAVTVGGPGESHTETLPDTSDSVVLTGSNGTNELGSGATPSGSFGSPAEGGTVTVNLGGGDDDLTIQSGSFATDTTIVVNGGAGTDGVTWDADGRIVSGTMTLSVSAESLTFASGSTLPVTIGNGTNDQIITPDPTGITIESGATLDISLAPDFVYTPGTVITLIDNQDPSSTVTGTFDGLPEGAQVIIDGHIFYISYMGGDGNDVVLMTQNDIVTQPATADGNEGDPINGSTVLTGATESYGRPLTAVLVDDVDPASGTLMFNVDGTFTFTPAVDFFGTVSFTFAADDGRDTGPTTTVTLTVINTPDAPVPSDNSYTILANDVLVGNVITDDTGNGVDVDVDEDVLSAVAEFKMTSSGMVNISADGTFFYQPNADFIGTDTFAYTVTDGIFQVPATVTVEVEARIVNVPLTTVGWNLFSYPIAETKAVADALSSIDGKYQTVWGFDNVNRVWQGYDVDAVAFSDLSELSLGNAYWITITEPVTIGFATTLGNSNADTNSAGSRSGSLRGSLPTPPTAFYGPINGVAPGTPMAAFIGGAECATGETFLHNGETYYKLYVISAEENPSCGYHGAIVTFQSDGAWINGSGVWRQGVFEYLDLTATATAVSLHTLQTGLQPTAPLTMLALFVLVTITWFGMIDRRSHRQNLCKSAQSAGKFSDELPDS